MKLSIRYKTDIGYGGYETTYRASGVDRVVMPMLLKMRASITPLGRAGDYYGHRQYTYNSAGKLNAVRKPK